MGCQSWQWAHFLLSCDGAHNQIDGPTKVQHIAKKSPINHSGTSYAQNTTCFQYCCQLTSWVRGGQCLRSRHRGVMLWVGFPAVPDAAQSKTPRDRKDSKEAASDDQDSPGRKTQLRDKGRKDYLKLPLSPPAAAAAATAPSHPPTPPLSSPTHSPLRRTGLLALRRGNQTCRQQRATKG